MAKFNFLQNSFSSGELSERMDGRTDIEEYYKGLSNMTNFLSLPQGGAAFRRGLSHHAVIEFGNAVDVQLIEYYSALDGKIYTVALLLNCTTAHSLQIYGESGRVTGVIFALLNTYVFKKRPDWVTNVVYSANDKAEFHYAQVGDVLFITDTKGKCAPIAVFRNKNGDFCVDSAIIPAVLNAETSRPFLSKYNDFALRVPYQAPNLNTDIRMAVSHTSGNNRTLTCQDAGGNPRNYFTGDWVGRHIKITHSAVTGVAYVTAKTNDNTLTVNIIVNFGATTYSTNWEESSWGGDAGYPKSVAHHEQRLFYGGSPLYQDTIWASRLGNPYHFMQRRLAQDLGSTDVSGLNYFGDLVSSDPFDFAPASREQNEIKWLHSSDELLCGTAGTEYLISGSDEQAISGTSLFIKAISSYGSCNVQPRLVENSLFFVSFDRKRILEIPRNLREYDFAVNIGVLSEGIIQKELRELLESFDPTLTDSTSTLESYRITELKFVKGMDVLFILVDQFETSPGGLIFGIGFNKTSKILSWSKVRSFSDTGQRDQAMSIGLISGKEGAGGLNNFLCSATPFRYSGVWCLEVLPMHSINFPFLYADIHSNVFGGYEDKTPLYLDGSLCYNAGSPTTTFDVSPTTELAFLDGRTLSVIADGIYIGELTVSGAGILTLPSAKTSIIIGVKYEGNMTSMSIEAGAQSGSAKGVPLRMNEASVYFINSRNGKYKSTERVTEYPLSLGSANNLFSGLKRIHLSNNPTDFKFSLIQDEPYPMHVMWWALRGATYDT